MKPLAIRFSQEQLPLFKEYPESIEKTLSSSQQYFDLCRKIEVTVAHHLGHESVGVSIAQGEGKLFLFNSLSDPEIKSVVDILESLGLKDITYSSPKFKDVEIRTVFSFATPFFKTKHMTKNPHPDTYLPGVESAVESAAKDLQRPIPELLDMIYQRHPRVSQKKDREYYIDR
jgi:hypothetical protein